MPWPSPLSRSRRPARRGLVALKLALVLVGGSLTVAAFTHGDTVAQRLAASAVAHARSEQRLTEVGIATFGTAFLQVPQTEQTAYVNQFAIRDLDKGLDPARPGGGLYPLRKAMEQLAGFVMFPLIIIAVLHALITGGGASDARLARVGIQFFTVCAMLWGYTLWDKVLYRAIALPITETLQSGPVVRNVIRSIGSPSGQNDLSEGLETTTPSAEIAAFWQNDAGCIVEAGADSPTGNAAKRCQDSSVPVARQRMHCRSLDGVMVGSRDDRVETLQTRMNPQLRDNCAEALEKSRGGNWFSRAWDAAKGAWNALANVGGFLSATVAGILLALESIIIGAVMWFVWLYVVVARAFSLALAPIAITWAMMPGGEEKAYRWFKGHAGIVLTPVGLAFATLVFYAVQVAILATPMMTNMVVGVALKFCLFLGFLFIIFKGSTLSNLLAGDVTSVAKDIGVSARNKTVQLAGTVIAGGVALGGAVAAGAGAGAAASGASTSSTTGKVAGKLAMKGATHAASALASQSGTSSMQGKFSLDGPVTAKGEPGLLRRIGGAIKEGAQNPMAVARFAWEHRTKERDVTAGPAGMWDAMVKRPFQDAKNELQKAQKERAERTLAQGHPDISQALDNMAVNKLARRQLAEQYGLTPHARAGEQIRVDPGYIVTAGRSAEENDRINALATQMIRKLVDQGIPLTVKAQVDGNREVYEFGRNSLVHVSNLLETDEQFRSLAEAEARAIWGPNTRAWPTVLGPSGTPILDAAALMKRSTAFAQASAATAQYASLRDEELTRRELVSHFVHANENSAFDRAARELSLDVAERLAGEEDDAYSRRVTAHANQVLRMAWFMSATEADRAAVLGKDHGYKSSLEARNDARIDNEIQTWYHADSFTTLPPAAQSAMRSAAALLDEEIQEKRERSAIAGGIAYGLDIETYLRSGGTTQEYTSAEGSLFRELYERHPELRNDQEKLYKMAFGQVYETMRDRLPPRRSDESETEYVRRVTPEIHRLIFLSEMSNV